MSRKGKSSTRRVTVTLVVEVSEEYIEDYGISQVGNQIEKAVQGNTDFTVRSVKEK